jgi:UDP-N-acetylmuramoyl-L-alanyl-D-glutamate--2,6-diaminopimelate ligase
MQTLHTPAEAVRWLRSHVTGALCTDSRRVTPGDGFIAWPGAATDGRSHVPAALAAGAAACLVEQEGVAAFGLDDTRVAAYPWLKAATGPIAAAYFEQPSAQLDVLAVTGTNGKTSTSWWLAQALSGLPASAGAIPCAVVGTLGIGVPPAVEYNGLTTPDPVLLQQQFRRFVQEGIRACAIEASSIGLAERRLDGTAIRVAIFTNFTQDHLDYHGSMAAYWLAKAELFRWPGLQAAVLNLDDPQSAVLLGQIPDAGIDVWTVAIHQPARLQALDVGLGSQGLRFTVREQNESHLLETRLIGLYNVSNLLGVLAAMRALGVPLAFAVQACRQLQPVPGRMECAGGAGEPLVAVDYAHTPDALDKALVALRPMAAQRGGQLWCVFGCGGDRDASKRPLMGQVAQQQADRVVLTSDNPRSEDPLAILMQIRQGLVPGAPGASAEVEPDRAQAIASVLGRAAAQDVVLIAGKGHEDYQEAAGVRRPFSDLAQARAALQARAARGGAAWA